MRKSKRYIRLDRIRELFVPPTNHKTKRGLGIYAFCDSIDYSYQAFEKVLYEGSEMSIETLVKISEVYGVTIDWLLGLSDKKYRGEE